MITTFTGPMFSGKSKKLIDVYNSFYNKKNIICFKPNLDTRDSMIITSRDTELEIRTFLIDYLEDIPNILDNMKDLNKEGRIILIDEAQFLKGNVKILLRLSIEKDYYIFISGLNLTTDLKPFGIMGDILAISDEIHFLKSSCYYCGRLASYTKCLVDKKQDILVGSNEYVPICNYCLKKGVK